MDKYRLHAVAANGAVKGKTFRMKEVNGELIPRDCTYPLTGQGKHDAKRATKEARK